MTVKHLNFLFGLWKNMKASKKNKKKIETIHHKKVLIKHNEQCFLPIAELLMVDLLDTKNDLLGI